MLSYPTLWEGSLFDQLQRLQREMDELFGPWPGPANIRNAGRGSFPPVNVGVSENQVDVYVFAPGMKKEDFDVSLQRNVLTVSGSREEKRPEGVNHYLAERFHGRFRRVIGLPEDVDPEKVDATYRDGVLRVTVQKHAASRPRRITIS